MNDRQPHNHDHDHDHHHHDGMVMEKDPAEQEALARDLAAELSDLFARFVAGEISFADLSFATYDVLQDLHVVATGAYELVAEDDTSEDTSDDTSDDEGDDEDGAQEDGDIDDPYDVEDATEQQEDLSGEPAR